ncbi:MFS transporter [Actinospica durhamensis]|uniref:MFS transporter n=1 Tax=Actinospica durhamensis TaxID=1508375 RepID=A0A941INJ7_9ACTN|nr:MFS transporter [Actinospica durhamensis]MBR7835485.1 MFS transporter [Actinospica durhamensis]
MSERTLNTAPTATAPRPVLPPAAVEAGSRRDVAPPGPEPRARPGLALAVILSAQLMLMIDATVMNVAVPRIEAGLHFSSASIAWVMDAYTLAFGGLLLLGGRLGDLFGRRRLFILGIVVFTLASLAGGLATGSAWLLTARVAQGVGAAMAGPSALALLNSTFTDPRARMRALALFSGVSSAGFGVGLVLGGVLTDAGSWRWVMFINIPFGVLAAALAGRVLRQPARHETSLDVLGALTATFGVGTLVYGLIHAASSGWGNTVTIAPIAAGVVLLTAFVYSQTRATHPLLPLHLFKDRNRAAAYANYMLGPAAGFGSFFFLSQYLQEDLHYSPLRTGFAFLPMSAIIFTASRLTPRLLPRFGPKPMALTGCVLLLIGLLGFAQVGEHTSYATGLLWPMIVMAVGMGLAFSPLTVVIMSSVRPQDAAAAGGTMQTLQQTGVSLGLAVLVTVSGSAARAHPATAISSGTHAAMLAAAVAAAASILVGLTFRKPKEVNEG